MKKKISVIILILVVSVLPFGYSDGNENVTKQDISQLENKMDSLESNLQKDNQKVSNEINQVNSSINSIDKKLSAHDEASAWAFNATLGIGTIQLFISIISGAIIAFITMMIGYLISVIRDKKIVKTFLNHDFDDVNDRVVILITNLRNTLQQIGPNGIIVDSLINRTIAPRTFMRSFLSGLLFFRWEAAVSKMNSLKHTEVEIISKLHGYVTQIDSLPPLDITLVSDTINQILNSGVNEHEQRRLISQALGIDLTTRLQHYDNVFHTMRQDLREIKWINLSDEHFR